jgi:hypothetical protein
LRRAAFWRVFGKKLKPFDNRRRADLDTDDRLSLHDGVGTVAGRFAAR